MGGASASELSGSWKYGQNNCAIVCNTGSGDRMCEGENAAGRSIPRFALSDYLESGKKYSACFANVEIDDSCFDAANGDQGISMRGRATGLKTRYSC